MASIIALVTVQLPSSTFWAWSQTY